MLHDPQPRPALRPRSTLPQRVLLTRSAALFEHGQAMARRAEALGIEVERLGGDRLPPLHASPGDARASYREAKRTLAVVVAGAGYLWRTDGGWPVLALAAGALWLAWRRRVRRASLRA